MFCKPSLSFPKGQVATNITRPTSLEIMIKFESILVVNTFLCKKLVGDPSI